MSNKRRVGASSKKFKIEQAKQLKREEKQRAKNIRSINRRISATTHMTGA